METFWTNIEWVKKHKRNIFSLEMDGRRISNNQTIADAFNDFFSNVGSNLDRKNSRHNAAFRHYLKDKVTHFTLHQSWNVV